MKRIVTALGLCTLLFVPATAYANNCSYDWFGGSSAWRDGGNWLRIGTDPNCLNKYPGEGGTGDMATIDVYANMPVTVSGGAVPNAIYWAVVDAETAGESDTTGTNFNMTLKIDTSGSLTVSDGSNGGYIQLIAGSHTYSTTLYTDDANLWVAAGSLTVDDIDVDGGFRSSDPRETYRGDRGLAHLLFDVAPTINDDVTVTGEANFVINANTTIGGELIVGDGNYYGDLLVSGNSTLYDDLTIQAPNQDGKDSIVQSSGSMDVVVTTYVIASESHDADATIWVSGGTFTTDAIEFDGSEDPNKGHAIGDFDVDVSVDGIAGTDTTLKGYVELKVDTNVEFETKETKVDSPNTHAEVIGVGQVIATTLTIDADAASAARKLTKLGSGKFRTTGTVTVKSDLDVANDAEIEVSLGTFEPYAITFEGSTNDTGHAIGDFDVGVTVGTCDGTIDTYMEGYVDITFTNSATVDSMDLGIGDSGGNQANVSLSGSGTLSACSVVIDGGSGANSLVTASNGAMLLTY